MKYTTLKEWLEWILSLHSQEMELGLARVSEVAKRLDLLNPKFPIITVAGTNGKGSCVAGLEAIYLAAGFRVGAFTSPYLFRFNEIVRIQGKEVDDEIFCRAFSRIEEAREEISLTPFEFNTLAALIIFQESNVDVGILEVGLGGRLDAVNIVDANIAIVTSISLDHTDLLGSTRNEIAIEKAGIFRTNQPAVCGDFYPPHSLVEYANQLQTPLYCQNKEFGFIKNEIDWEWRSNKTKIMNLPLPSLHLQNMSTVLMAVELLQEKLAVSVDAIKQGLAQVKIPGRIQVITGKITRIYDVSHNPGAAEWLAKYLKQTCHSREDGDPSTIDSRLRGNDTSKVRAVFSMLADKDIVSTLHVMRETVHHWYSAPLLTERGASKDVLDYCFRKAGISNHTFSSIKEAYQRAIADSSEGDVIVVFGSFYTVGATF